MQESEIDLAIRLMTQIRSEFDRLRWQSGRIEGSLMHKATNAEAEGVRGIPQNLNHVFAFEGAGHRDPFQRFDDAGQPLFRDDAVVDVHGNPIVDSDGRPLDVVMPAFRSISFTGDNKGHELLKSITIRAGRVASTLGIPALGLVGGWRFSTWSDLWWALVFELAWSGKHPLLRADKRLWIPADEPTTFLPYDLTTIQQLASSGFPKMDLPANWLKRLPEAWVSEIDDVVVASIDTADYVLAELLPHSQQTQTRTEATASELELKHDDHPRESESEMQLRRRFKVAISFPGEYRHIVSQVANHLKEALGEPVVFYDKFHQIELAGPNLDLKLTRIYKDDSDLIVVMVCGKYDEKEWCGIEWRAVRELVKSKSRVDEDVMFLRIDDGDIEGMLSIDGFIDVRNTKPLAIAHMIIRRWSASR